MKKFDLFICFTIIIINIIVFCYYENKKDNKTPPLMETVNESIKEAWINGYYSGQNDIMKIMINYKFLDLKSLEDKKREFKNKSFSNFWVIWEGNEGNK